MRRLRLLLNTSSLRGPLLDSDRRKLRELGQDNGRVHRCSGRSLRFLLTAGKRCINPRVGESDSSNILLQRTPEGVSGEAGEQTLRELRGVWLPRRHYHIKGVSVTEAQQRKR